MKHYLITFSLVFTLIFLSCTDNDEIFTDNPTLNDSLGQQIDSFAPSPTDSIPWETDSIVADTVATDIIIFPIDTLGRKR